jgi:ATPase family protein associated with various cellular activities (AAA)
MSIHKLNPERGPPEQRPLSIGVSFQESLSDMACAVVQLRALQAIESSAARYPIHRHVRCAAHRKLEDVFDDLALGTGLVSHRLDTGTLMLDGPGLFVHARGWRKTGYSACSFHIWADSKVRADEARDLLLSTVGPRHLPEETFIIAWHFCEADGTLRFTSFEELAEGVLHDEAYPTLGAPVPDFVRRYLASSETVLILQGSPGSGKTRLVRAILAAISRRKGEAAEVMYTADMRALENDEIYVDFITGSHDAFVIEDADHLLKARDRGNHHLHRFLAVADGVVRAQGRKIIFSTNLPNVGDLDEALLRPGRCFAAVRTRLLRGVEIERLIARLCDGDASLAAVAQAALGPEGAQASVAEIYRACAAARGPRS